VFCRLKIRNGISLVNRSGIFFLVRNFLSWSIFFPGSAFLQFCFFLQTLPVGFVCERLLSVSRLRRKSAQGRPLPGSGGDAAKSIDSLKPASRCSAEAKQKATQNPRRRSMYGWMVCGAWMALRAASDYGDGAGNECVDHAPICTHTEN
jgi:hypothetical protein